MGHMLVPQEDMGGAGGGLTGLYHELVKLIVGVFTLPEKVAGLNVEQVITCVTGLTLFVGATVLMPIATDCVMPHPVSGSTP